MESTNQRYYIGRGRGYHIFDLMLIHDCFSQTQVVLDNRQKRKT